MEQLFNSFDKEYMKMAMLKHEETFREQLYELHRLYQIQKLLMKNIATHGQESDRRDNFKIASKSNQTSANQDIHKRPPQCLDLELPAEEYVPGNEGHGAVHIDDESELELTLGLGPTSHYRWRKALETSLPSDSATSFSSSSTESSHIKRTNSGNHQRTNALREELIKERKWGLDLPSSNPSVLGARKNGSDIEERLMRQDRCNNPPWLFQALSLNTT